MAFGRLHAVQTICDLPTLLCKMRRVQTSERVCVLAGAHILSVYPFLPVRLPLSVFSPSVRPFGFTPQSIESGGFKPNAIWRCVSRNLGFTGRGPPLIAAELQHQRGFVSPVKSALCTGAPMSCAHAVQFGNRTNKRRPFSSRELPQGSRVH